MASAGTGSPEKTSVSVALRIRPITNEDLKNLPTRFQRQVITTSPFVPNQVIVHADKKLNFSFDNVFGPEATQRDVYEKSVLGLIDKFIEGYNATILAYGQTSSGKTHTMGTADNASQLPETKGIIPRAMASLFSAINSTQYRTRKFAIKVSFIEIYNEDLIDLLGERDGDERPQITIREDNKGNILWSGLQEFRVNSVEEVMGHLARGSLNRQVGATEMNVVSSRSHAIFSVTLTQQKFVPANGNSASPIHNPPTPLSATIPSSTVSRSGATSRSSSRMSKRFDEGDWVTVTSKFHFVDLAGSERLKRTSAIGERAKEGISINSGLLALGNVISALGDPYKAKHQKHIPYRDSKLTRLLQDSLGGNAQTLMIACVSPAEFNLNETVNTIKYANRARNIKNQARVNEEESGWQDVEHLQSLVIKLRNEIRALKDNNGIGSRSVSRAESITHSGRSTPINGFESPTHTRQLSNPLSDGSFSNAKDKDVGLLEEQLKELQQSYFELSQKYAKSNAELAKHQDNFDGVNNPHMNYENDHSTGAQTLSSIVEEEEKNFMLRATDSFQEAVEPVIKEYEISITKLEGELAFSRAAVKYNETKMLEQENKLKYAEELNRRNENWIKDLTMKIAKMTERESTTELYIKDLEQKLQEHSAQQKKDLDLITELRGKITQLKTSGAKNENYIQDLEMRLVKSDEQIAKFNKSAEELERRLQEREEAYQALQIKLKQTEEDTDRIKLINEISDRDRRITMLEKKVEDLVFEIDKLRKFTDHDHEGFISSSSSPSFEEDTPLSTPPSSNTPTPVGIMADRFVIAELESKLAELQKNHNEVLAAFAELKEKYDESLREIEELRQLLNETKLLNINIIDSEPNTPRTSTYPPESGSDSLADSLKLHRRARSLSNEINGNEKADLVSAVIVQNLEIELKQMEMLHNEKIKGLEDVRQELARLEMNHRENLEIVEELRDEIKKRDELAQIEVRSVLATSEYNEGSLAGFGGYSATTSEVDQLDIVQRLRDEVEQLKDEQRRTMEVLSEHQRLAKSDQVLKLESEIEHLKSELRMAEEAKDNVADSSVDSSANSDDLKTNTKEHVIKLEAKVKELEEKLEEAYEIKRKEYVAEAAARLEGVPTKIQVEEVKDEETPSDSNDESIALQQQMEKLQGLIEAKSQIIATLLLPSIEQQNTIRRLEDELQQAQEALRRTLEEKNKETNDAQQNDETIKALEEKIKDLDAQLTNAKEAQHVPTPRSSYIHVNDPMHKNLDALYDKLKVLQKELATKAETIPALKDEQDLVNTLQEQLDTLKSDIKRKYELIDMLKRDLADKSLIQQRLKSKEAEVENLKVKLTEVLKKEEAITLEISELEGQLDSEINGGDLNQLDIKNQILAQKTLNIRLQSELDQVKEELKAALASRENRSEETEELSQLLTDTLRQSDENAQRADELARELENLKANDSNKDSTVSQDRVLELEQTLKQLETDKDNEIKQLKQQVEQFQNELVSLTDEFAKYEEVEEISRQQKLQITEAEKHIATLTEKVKRLEKDLEEAQKLAMDIKEMNELHEKIKELEAEKEGLEQANNSFFEERGRLDQRIESLMQQLETVGAGGNKAASTIAEQNNKIVSLEKELASLIQRSKQESNEMEQEIERLLLENEERLAKQEKTSDSKSPESGAEIDNLQSKLTEQEDTIAQQSSLIKSLQEKLSELEQRSNDNNINSPREASANPDSTDNFRMSTLSTSSNSSDLIKKGSYRPTIAGNLVKAPPPTPPPSLPLPPPPTALPPIPQGPGTPPPSGYSTPIPPPPRSPLPRSESAMSKTNVSDTNTTRDDLAQEIQKLHKKIAKMEGENIQSRQEVEELKSKLSDAETNVRVATQQLSVLQSEKQEYVEQIKTLRKQLDDARHAVEYTRSTVEEEKKTLENWVEEERKAKEKAERAKMALE
ncbi:3497_t:CDS:2, partial [Ambispora leptoticha]